MKIRTLFFVLGLSILASASQAQTTTSLFGPTAITQSPDGTDNEHPFTFGTDVIFLTCPAGATATLSGPGGGDLITDNDLLVNGTTVCPFPDGCFDGTISDPLLNLGQPAETAYNGVAPIDISSSLVEGLNVFRLVDRGYTYASSAIDLTTTCTVGYPVCHSSGQGRSKFKTLVVGSLNAVAAHVRNHAGDHAGACTGDEGSRGRGTRN